MARVTGTKNPQRRSHSSEFFISLANITALDGDYTVMGQLVKGAPILDKLGLNSKIKDLRVFVRPSGTAKKLK